MIDSRQTFAPSEEVVKKAAEVTVERLTDCQYRVVPNDTTKAVRIVEFEYTDNEVMTDCYEEGTGEGCPGNDHRKMCYHVFSVLVAQEQEERPE